MSRCTIPLAWEAASASATWMLISSSFSVSIAWPEMHCFRLSPSSFSITMNGCPLLSSMPWMVQILGWFSSDAALASRSNRSSDLGSPAKIFRDEFQRNVPPQLQVFGLVNHAHAAAPELSQNAVMGYGLADHERATLPTAVMLGFATDSGQLSLSARLDAADGSARQLHLILRFPK